MRGPRSRMPEAKTAAGGALSTVEAVNAAFASAAQVMQQGRLEEAAALWPEVIAGYEALEGPTGQGTLTAKGAYAIVLAQQGKLEEAGSLYREVVKGKTAALSATHASTLAR